jgi:hypothetical protein
MRRTSVFLVLAAAAVLTAKGAVASKKANRLEDRYASNYAATWNLLNQLQPLASNATFLAALSKLPHQTTANNTIDTTAGSLSNADRVSINGLVNAVNTLQSNLQARNFES